MEADEALARALQAEEDALAAPSPAPSSRDAARSALAARLQGGLQTALQYESRELRRQARAVMPLLQLRARAAAAVLCSAPESGLTVADALLTALLRWFKADFFTWVNAPPCARCGGATAGAGMAAPTAEEAAGGASRVEAYTCCDAACRAAGPATRFPRFNDARVLLRTHRGRCGEWANAFTLCCRAAGLRARYCLDLSDHVWTEVFCARTRRWVHADSCEAARDTPRLYDAGWGKKLSYVFAFDATGAADVTRRYVVDWPAALGRRAAEDEAWLREQLRAMTAALRARLPRDAVAAAERREADDVASIDAAHASDVAAKAEELPGRESGALGWRAARGELGPGQQAAPTQAAPTAAPADALATALAAALAAALASAPPRQEQQ